MRLNQLSPAKIQKNNDLFFRFFALDFFFLDLIKRADKME